MSTNHYTEHTTSIYKSLPIPITALIIHYTTNRHTAFTL